jgi:hypothetical protein
MKLSPHFTLRELTKSQTAERLGIDNTPGGDAVEALRALCANVLEPVRLRFGPLSPSSGYRGPKLNAAIGGSGKSQHMRGEAADIEVAMASNPELARWIVANLEFDQLILEFYVPGDPRSGWVHVSYTATGRNRREVLTAVKGQGYHKGLIA